ncbi:MAG TPA: NAD(P)H-hydrate dehydratase [Candidatus Baltobacteraceae bacterium]|jgi:NAD(P)H-hydrate epimerase|nr:NAD(P)H-hydrate dehydratase [Candidatus Baltobacteraceae bacterium]
MHVLTAAQMRAADAQASATLGDVALMRAAGERIAETARRYAKGLRIAGFAGPGNNGGDAFAALARLRGYDRVLYAQPAPNPSAARTDAQAQLLSAGVPVHELPRSLEDARAAIADCGLVVVGLVGTGARLPLPQTYAPLIEALNESAVPVLAIDIPPGVDAESGAVVEPALRADVTVTLGALKLGLLLTPGRANAGDLWLGDIGMPQETIANQHSGIEALGDDEFRALLPSRANAADKRSAGAPLIIAGSAQFPGAAVLCAMGAARAGAGYVTVATPEAAAPALRMHLIEQVAVTIPMEGNVEEAAGDLLDVSKRCTSVAIGPGLGLDDRTGEIVRNFCDRVDLPLVIDASGLFHFAKNLELLRGKRVVLTPHAGEFARLSGKGTVREEERVSRLREFVDRTGITTLLKGESTLVYDGTTLHVNTTGSPALATAGTGDVLTGVISTLLAQGLAPVDAARAGAFWHGLAGQAAARVRSRGVIARDVFESLAVALEPQPNDVPHLKRIF